MQLSNLQNCMTVNLSKVRKLVKNCIGARSEAYHWSHAGDRRAAETLKDKNQATQIGTKSGLLGSRGGVGTGEAVVDEERESRANADGCPTGSEADIY